jgi:hypothetical protein
LDKYFALVQKEFGTVATSLHLMRRLKHKIIVGQVLRSFVILLSQSWTILLILLHPGHCVNDANSHE